MKGPIDKICEACNEPFVCGQYGCWCAQMGVTEKQMEWLESSFEDCLCPLCLKKVVNGELGPAPAGGSE